MKYLFAFSQYHTHATPTYYAVRADFSLFISNDWDVFYKETGLYCAHRIKLFCEGEHKEDGKEVYTHANYSPMFIVDWERGAITPISDNDIEFYERESDPEKTYFNACTVYAERN